MSFIFSVPGYSTRYATLRPVIFFIAILVGLFQSMQMAAATSEALTEITLPSTITVQGEGYAGAEPDRVNIVFGILGQDKNAHDALRKNRQRVDALRKLIEEFEIPRTDYQTQHYDLSPVYAERRYGDSYRIIQYRAESSITVTLTVPDVIGVFIDRAVKKGVERVDSITFGIGDDVRHRLVSEARRKAVRAAERSAHDYAEAAGMRLGLPETITTGSIGVPQPRLAASVYADVEYSSPVIAPSSYRIRDVVTITYRMEPAR